jgi:hypothetical protein
MQPTSERFVDPDRSGLAGQKEEYRLKRIVSVVAVVQDAAANGQDHRSVALNQSLERQLVALKRVQV